MKIKSMQLKNNKGIAMVTILVTIMFLAVIATTLLYISSTNYMMKVANQKGKENFYETDGVLVKTTSSIRNACMKDSNPITSVNQLKTTVDDSCGNYSMLKIAQLVYPSATGGATNAYATVGSDSIEFKTSNNQIVKTTGVTPGVTTYTFKDIEIVQTSTEGYKNSVKTDLQFDVYEKVTPGGSAGGVGNMSMMLDSPLTASAANFKCLTMTGNAFMADYGSEVTWDGEQYIAPGTGGLVISNESRLNLKGSNNVVYGDLHLSGNASVAVYGNLTVYGDIVLEDDSTLIISEGGSLYQFKAEALPGRSTPSTCTSAAHNCYPYPLVINEVTKDNFKDFAKTIGINKTLTPGTDEHGLIKRVFRKVPALGNKRVIEMDCAVEPGTTYSSELDAVSGGMANKNGFKQKNSIYNWDKIGCGFLSNNVGSALNGGFDNYLIICLDPNPIVMQETNPYSTWICNSSVSSTQAHCITLSKIGTDQFNYMTAAKGDTESAVYNTSDNPFNNVSFKFGGTTYTGKFGDFFDQNCNAYVDQMFGYSIPGGGAGSVSYSSAMNFTNYSRDFE